jgi:lipoprotein-releasing system ATP-binding protein
MIAELKHINKIYNLPGTDIQQRVLEDICLEINENESISITGPSGSGKSTLLNLLGTLDQPTSGQVLINGIEPDYQKDTELASLRNRFIGFVFQSHYLLPQLTILENVILPVLPHSEYSDRNTATTRAEKLLERVGLENRLHHRPSQVSIGECQRAAVVRALINQPRLLLADEPTGSLDAANAMQLINLLIQLKQEQSFSMVIVTHSNEIAAQMDRKMSLASGKLIQL